MIDPIVTTLQAISNAKTILDLVVGVSRYVRGKSKDEDSGGMRRGVLSYAERQEALEATFSEWEHVAAVVAPAIGREVGRLHSMALPDRAEALARLAGEYAAVEIDAPTDKLDQVLLRHTAFARRPDGKLELRFGQSERTKSLLGESIDVARDDLSSTARRGPGGVSRTGGDMQLPVFKVTMLGDSGVGKTVFMSSMYAKLRDGENGISIRALSNEVDRELDIYVTSLFTYSTWPPGSEGKIKTYDFELLLRGRPIARIDWVDYRGGVLTDSGQDQSRKEEVASLVKRLQESHSILWMVDLSRLAGKPIHTMAARLITRVQRMAQLTRQAAAGENCLRSVLFVRTKSDEVLSGDAEPDWDLACDQLLDHIGRNNYGDIGCAAAIPVSSSGRVNAADKQVMGDDPTNVEWPLILALAFMLKVDLNRLDGTAEDAYQAVTESRHGRLVQFIKDTIGMGMSDDQIRAMHDLETVAKQVIGMREIIGELLKHRPSSIRMFQGM
jgi:hypothetical protein